jgi:hypothetical protein
MGILKKKADTAARPPIPLQLAATGRRPILLQLTAAGRRPSIFFLH